LLSRSSRESVTHLRLISVIIEDQVLLSILDMLPSLSHLAIGDAIFHSRIQEEDEDDEDYIERIEELDDAEPTMLSPFFLRTLSEVIQISDRNRMPRLVELHLGFGSFGVDVIEELAYFLSMSQMKECGPSLRVAGTRPKSLVSAESAYA
jgi:hypothetical protein